MTADGYRFSSDNTQSVGTPSNRASTIYAGTGAINTSDETAKQQIEALPTEWLDAWADVEWCRFKFNDAVEQKGDSARWHIGLIAQRVHAAFEARGLDAFAIGLCNRDQWEEEREPIMRMVRVPVTRTRPAMNSDESQIFELKEAGELPDGKPVLALTLVMEEFIEHVEQLEPTGETKIVREAGTLWGLRYAECQALEAAYQRREIARGVERERALEARLAKVEAALARLA